MNFTKPEKLIIGENYHVDGLNKGCVFRLVSIGNIMAKMETPKHKRPFSFHKDRLRNVRRNQDGYQPKPHNR